MKILKKVLLGLVVFFVAITVIGIIGTFSDSGDKSKEEKEVTATDISTPEPSPEVTQEPTEEPVSTPEPTPVPTATPAPTAEPTEEPEEELPNYVIIGNSYQGLYDDHLFINLFPEENDDIKFNIYKFDDNGNIIPEYCLQGVFAKNKEEDGNTMYTSEKVSMIYIAYDRTYFVQSVEGSGYQIEMEFRPIDEITSDDEGGEEEYIKLTTQKEVFDFFSDSSNVGKKFDCYLSFNIYTFNDYRDQLGYGIENSWYYVTFYDYQSGKNFSACVYGWSDQNRIMDGSNIFIKGTFSSNKSANADFDIIADEIIEAD